MGRGFTLPKKTFTTKGNGMTNQLGYAVLTVSDTRTLETDSSGDYLTSALANLGHQELARAIVKDEPAQIRAQVARWVADGVEVIVTTGGTGFSGRDSTIEAVSPLFDTPVDGFGELFRALSFDDIKSSTIQSRATAGFSYGSLVVCLPGSRGACELAFERILSEQLNPEFKPCNFVNLLKRGDARLS